MVESAVSEMSAWLEAMIKAAGDAATKQRVVLVVEHRLGMLLIIIRVLQLMRRVLMGLRRE